MIQKMWGVVVACGKSEQIEGGLADAAFLNLGGRPMLYYALSTLEKCPEIDCTAVVADKERLLEIQQMAAMYGFTKLRKLMAAPKQRMGLTRTVLRVIDDPFGYVGILEVSRPFTSVQVITDCVKKARRFGCAQAVAPVEGHLRAAPKTTMVAESFEAQPLWVVQSPFVCKTELLEKFLQEAEKRKYRCQDELNLAETCKHEVRLVPDSPWNIKITSSRELGIAEALLKANVIFDR